MAEAVKVEPGKYSKQFPELSVLLGCYFHGDMFDVFDWAGNQKGYKPIIRYVKSIQNEEHLSSKISDLREFLELSRNWDEDKLSDVLGDDFRCLLYAPHFKITYRQFLEGILQILEEPMEKTKSEFIPKFIG